MHLTTRNVNSAFQSLVRLFASGDNGDHDTAPTVRIVEKPSRNGPVLMIEEPVIVTYTHPTERVLFNMARDANPFFHLYESLWMLAGQNDAAPLAYYAKNIINYSDDWSEDDGDGKPGGRMNGAYGYRWRKAKGPLVADLKNRVFKRDGVDQLNLLVEHLRVDPNSRRAVLQMWNVEDDLLKIGGACTCGADRTGPSAEAHDEKCPAGRPVSKDVCCNLSVMFSLRGVHPQESYKTVEAGQPELRAYRANEQVLDMTVTNRSNDLIWGMLGANVVHFSFLQEYLAARLGVGVGVYNQMSNNLHVYLNNFKPTEWLVVQESMVGGPVYLPLRNGVGPHLIPLVTDPAQFEEELPHLVNYFGNPDRMFDDVVPTCWEPFLRDVAIPMLQAFRRYKLRSAGMLQWANQVKADDWRAAAVAWLERRIRKWESSGQTSHQS